MDRDAWGDVRLDVSQLVENGRMITLYHTGV